MSDDEIDLMPFGFLKKYGSMVNKIDEYFKIEK